MFCLVSQTSCRIPSLGKILNAEKAWKILTLSIQGFSKSVTIPCVLLGIYGIYKVDASVITYFLNEHINFSCSMMPDIYIMKPKVIIERSRWKMTDRSALNPGLSMMNFDGLDLQNQQEKELQRESEQQQNEVWHGNHGNWTQLWDYLSHRIIILVCCKAEFCRMSDHRSDMWLLIHAYIWLC